MNTPLHTILSVLPCMVCLFWSLIFAIDWNHSERATRALLGFSLTCTLLYACHAVHFVCASTGYSQWVDCLWSVCNLAVYPIFYIYIRHLTGVPAPTRRTLWLLTPSLVAAILSLAVTVSGRPFEIVNMYNTPVFAIEIILTAVFGRKCLVRYREKIRSFYADTDDKSLNSLDTILALLVTTSAVSIVANALGRDSFSGLALIIPSFTFSALLFGIFFWGHEQHFSAEHFILNADDTGKDIEAVAETDTLHSGLYQQICQLMEEEKLYLGDDLKITDLATRIGTNRTYVSSCINQYSGYSFSDFVHKYRIEHALAILEKDRELSMAKVAELSGYKNGNSFYKAFVRIKGIPPTKWMESHRM